LAKKDFAASGHRLEKQLRLTPPPSQKLDPDQCGDADPFSSCFPAEGRTAMKALMTASTQTSAGFAARLAHLYGNIRNCFSSDDGFQKLDRDLQRQTALDLGMAPERLAAVSRKGEHGADEMDALMHALHIDPVEVRLLQPAAYRDMQASCALCASKETCRHDLGEGTAATHFAGYCNNAVPMNGLRAEPDLLED
jgi:Family of unknown function (DUF6455)